MTLQTLETQMRCVKNGILSELALSDLIVLCMGTQKVRSKFLWLNACKTDIFHGQVIMINEADLELF